jgi:hypothetical protein
MLETLVVSLAVVSVAMTVVNVVVVGMFLRRQRELEELALIDAKERREYLAQASSRMAAQTDSIRRAEKGLMHSADRDFDPLSIGNRRMREEHV